MNLLFPPLQASLRIKPRKDFCWKIIVTDESERVRQYFSFFLLDFRSQRTQRLYRRCWEESLKSELLSEIKNCKLSRWGNFCQERCLEISSLQSREKVKAKKRRQITLLTQDARAKQSVVLMLSKLFSVKVVLSARLLSNGICWRIHSEKWKVYWILRGNEMKTEETFAFLRVIESELITR